MAAEAWIVRAGRDDEYAAPALDRGIVGLAWHRVGDLTGATTPRAVRSLVAEAYPDEPAAVRTLYALQLHAFRTTLRPGHLVVLLRQSVPEVALGEITGDYEYKPAPGEPTHVRRVRWIHERLRRSELGSDLLAVPGLYAVNRVTRPADRERVAEAAAGVPVVREPVARSADVATQSAADSLRRNLTYARDLAAAGSHLEALGVTSFEFRDVYRAAWVQAVSSLDHWVSQEIHDRTLQAGRQPDPKMAFRSFTQPKKIVDGLRTVADVSDLWSRVSGVLGGAPAPTATDIVHGLQTASDRRNRIAHECDEDPANPPYKRPIDVTGTMATIALIDQVTAGILLVIDGG
jgi:restriction system protein